jgi:ribosome-associated protein
LIKEEDLVKTIIEGILEKKGKQVTIIDLSTINYAFCDFFIICHGDSNTQISAIAESVGDKVKEKLKVKYGHIEGIQNAQWVLIDYSSVIVHIFQKEYRDYYKLEDLWGDAQITKIEDE